MATWLGAVWQMLLDSGFLFLIGLTLAGLMSLVLNAELVQRLVGGRKLTSVLKAALIGVPLPLCSCSVLPIADQLHRSGMKKGPLSAFLISTPESGLDSIMLTYSLTDPLLTVARPISAFATAFLAGMIQSNADDAPSSEAFADSEQSACCSGSADSTAVPPKKSRWQKLWQGIRYAYTDLIADLAPYLLFGFLAAGLLEVALGDYLRDLPPFWKEGIGGYAGAILSGLPLYICATSSTPLAAVLLTFGFSPGAVLVFLLVGPATNVASVVVIRKVLGTVGTIKYLIAIVIGAVVCGLLTDAAYAKLGIEAAYRATVGEHGSSYISILSAGFLSLLIVYYTVRKIAKIARRFLV